MSVASSEEKPYLMGMENMRFLYLSTSADHASSLPRRQPCTRRVSGHAERHSSNVADLSGAIGLALANLTHVKLFNIPQHVRVQNCRSKIPNPVLRAHENIRAGQAYHRNIFSDDFLDAVIQMLPLGVVQSGQLQLHQAVDFSFPLRCRLGLSRVPEMSLSAREPD